MLSTSDAIKVRKFDWNNGKYFPLHPEFERGIEKKEFPLIR